MIKTETEYRLTCKQIDKNRKNETKQRAALAAAGFDPETVEIAMEPTITFHQQFVEEVQWYERVRAGDLTPIHNLNHIGQMLIGLRISRGLTQKQLAQRLNISESIISRDERNDYHGISVERAQRILDALDGQATMIISSKAAQTAPPARGNRRRFDGSGAAVTLADGELPAGFFAWCESVLQTRLILRGERSHAHGESRVWNLEAKWTARRIT